MLRINVVNIVSVIDKEIGPCSNHSKENREKSPISLATLSQLLASPGFLTYFLVGFVIGLKHKTQ